MHVHVRVHIHSLQLEPARIDHASWLSMCMCTCSCTCSCMCSVILRKYEHAHTGARAHACVCWHTCMRMLASILVGADGLRQNEGRGSHQMEQLRPRCKAGSTQTQCMRTCIHWRICPRGHLGCHCFDLCPDVPVVVTGGDAARSLHAGAVGHRHEHARGGGAHGRGARSSHVDVHAMLHQQMHTTGHD